MTTARASYDLGLIIPTREEFEYMRLSMPFRPIDDVAEGYWFEFSIPGQRSGVAHVLFDVGLLATATATGRLLATFSPEVVAVVGIGGGLNPDLALGDVVVGSVIQEYLKAAKVASDPASGTVIQPSGDSWPLAERFRNFANHFKFFAEESHRDWVRFARIRAAEDSLPLAATPGARRETDYSVLPIASGDLVVADPAFKQWLTRYDRRRSVVEMEAAGAARAVREYDKDVALLVLRGISDFADQQKSALEQAAFDGMTGVWRRYAAQNAIELLLAFLASPHFPWREPAVSWPSKDQRPVSADDDPAGAAGSAARRAWESFMRAAPLIQGVSGAVGLIHELGSAHHQATGGHNETMSHGGGVHGPQHQDVRPGSHLDHHHSIYHGEHALHDEHTDHSDLDAEDSEHGPDEPWYASDIPHLSGADHFYYPDASHTGPDHDSHLDGHHHVTDT